MAKTPCAVFWDIQNIAVPRGQSAASIVSLVRSSIIKLYNLKEIYFYCVADVTKLPATVGNPLTNQDVNIIQAYDYTKDSADIKILDLMRKFVQNQGQKGCAIILLSGDGDYAGTLIDLKKLYNITIFVIRLAVAFSAKLEAAANYTFTLTNGKLKPTKSDGLPQFFVSFSRFPLSREIKHIKSDLTGMTQPYGSIDKSAVTHEDEVIIGFPSLELARRAVERLNTARYHGTFLKAEILQNPPQGIIIKVQNACSTDVLIPKQSQSVKKVNTERQVLPDNQILTFIKVSQLTDLLSEAELTHHFAKLTIPYESKYVKFHQSSIWIAFSSANQVQEALNKLKSSLLIGKPIVVAITNPPHDLLSSSVKQELSLSSELSSLSSSQSTSNPEDEKISTANIPTDHSNNHHDSNTIAQLQCMNSLTSTSSQSHGDIQNYYICLTGYSESTFQTKWSLTYKILYEIRDYHPKKLFIEDEIVWLWFTNEIYRSQALNQINSEFIKTWPSIKVDPNVSPKINLPELVSSYSQSNPWCFTSDFELYFLKVNAIENFTDEMERDIRETVKGTQVDLKLNCIFVKLDGGSLWAAFPDLMCCLDAEFLVSTHQQIRSNIKITWTKAAPIGLLQSIGLEDLIGEAKCLAELLVIPEQSVESDNASVHDDSIMMLTDRLNQVEIVNHEEELISSTAEVKEVTRDIYKPQSANEPATNLIIEPAKSENTFICLMGAPNAQFPTHWSLFINMVQQLILTGLTKAILVNEIFWCKFESETNCQTVLKKLQSHQINLLPLIHVSVTPQPSADLLTQLAFHQSCHPFCITPELRLHYMRCTLLDSVTSSSTVDEMVEDIKKLLTVASKVIFVKAVQSNTIWAGFPSGRTCDSAIVTIVKHNTWKIRVDLLHIKKAPEFLLPLIQTQDLFGEAFELTHQWMKHIRLSKSNSIITLSSSSSSLSSSPTQSIPENKPVHSAFGTQFESQIVVPKVTSMKPKENAPKSSRRSRTRRRGRGSRDTSSTTNGSISSKKSSIKSFVTCNSAWMQFANIRNLFICLNGVTNAEFTTFWSLIYNIVAQTVNHHIYKVIMEGGDFWLYFDDKNQCQQVVNKFNRDENFFKSMKMKKSISPSKKLVTTISSYHPDCPWCFTNSLGLNYLKLTGQNPLSDVVSSAKARSLQDIIRTVSSEFKCIFVKHHEGTIWAAFPSIRTCDNAKKTLNDILVHPLFVQTVHPRSLPINLLESIGTSDLVGDASTLSNRWFEMKNATFNHSTESSDKNDLAPQINFITTSMSIDSDTDSNSVISDHINTDRYLNQKLYSSDGRGETPPIPEATYMVNRISTDVCSGGQAAFLTIGDVYKLPRGRFKWQKQIVQAFVDFVDIPPRAACLDNNFVHFHYNTIEEAERAKKVIESKLFEDIIQFTASISNDAPTCWSAKQKYYYSVPRTLPTPPRRQITYIIISPIAKKESRLFTNTLLAALQPFYVYFIRHFEEALWIGIGCHEQAEAAVATFTEHKLLNDSLTVSIDKKLPRDFWKIIRGETKTISTNVVTNLSSSKASSVNGSTNQLNQSAKINITTAKVTISTVNQITTSSTGVSSISSNQVQKSTGLIKTSKPPDSAFSGTKTNGEIFTTPESQKNLHSTTTISRIEPEPRISHRIGYLIDPLPSNGSVSSIPNSTTSTTNSAHKNIPTITSSIKLSNDTSSKNPINNQLSKEIISILTNPTTWYLNVMTYPATVMTKEAVSHVKGKLIKYGCLFVTKLPDSILSGFYGLEKRNAAQKEIDGSNYMDIFGHNYTFLTRSTSSPPLNLLSILKTSDLTISSGHLSSFRSTTPSLNPSSLPLSYTSYNSARQTAVITPAVNHPLMSTSSNKNPSSNAQPIVGQPGNSNTQNTPNGKLEDSDSSKKPTKKSKSGNCSVS